MRKIYLLFALLFGYVCSQGQRLSSAEYYFGADPGVGQATALSITQGDSLNQVFNVPISALAQGFNMLSVRVKDSSGIWSQTHTKLFYKLPVSVSGNSTPRIERMEYFVDVDPGLGQATPINFTSTGDSVYQVFSIPVNTLSEGFHNLSVRVQDSLGIWSQTLSRIFYKLPLSASAPTTPNVMRMEYFVDADPGLGQGTEIVFSQTGDSVYQLFSVPVSSYSLGFHNLSVRIQDSLGIWSTTMSKIFYVLSVNAGLDAARIKNIEYFVDDDPGLGNGTPLSINVSDSINQAFTMPINGMDSGLHHFSVRVMDSLGIWSHILSDTFRVLGCNSPLSGFSTQANVCVGDTLNLSNTTTGTDQWISYQWDMDGDGVYDFSALGDTAYIFDTIGTYNIKLKATNSSIFSFGCVDTSTFTVHVRPLPTTNVTAYGSTTFCQGDDVPLNANYGLGYTYQWLKDDTAVANATSSLINITESGDYTVEITTFYGCIDTSAATNIVVNPLPPSTISSVGSTNICQGTNLTLQANTGTNLSYIWKKNGAVLSGETSDQLVVGDAASYTVDVTNANGCVNTSAPYNVSVQPVPNAVITTGGTSTICQGDLLNFYGPSGSGYSYQWIKDGQAISGANSVYYSITQSGSYQVIVTNASLCTDTSTAESATVNPTPSSSFVAQGASTICQGDSVALDAIGNSGLTYQWKNYGQAIPGANDSVYQAKQSGNYSLVVTNSYNCPFESAPQSIVVNPVPGANILPLSSTTFCAGDSVRLQANFDTSFSYQWYKNGLPLAGETQDKYTALSSGAYTVQVQSAANCNSLSVAANVNVFPIPTSAFSLLNQSCSADTVQIAYSGTATSGAFYNWNFDGGTILSGTGQGPYQVKWDSAGYKNVQLTVSENACQSTLAQQSIEIKAVAASLSSANTSVCQGDSVMLYANGGNHLTYSWYQGGLPIPVGNFSSLAVLQSGNYQVEVTDTVSGCSQLSNPIAAYINPTDFNLDFSANTTSFSQPPFAVTFNNQTPNINNYQFEWDLGDGSTSTFYHPGHSYQYNGDYTVSLFAEDATTGCRDTLIKTDYISCTGGAPNPCNILAAITPAGPVTICGGDSVLLTANAGTGYSYQWVYNNMIITGADSISLWVKQAGNYRVIVSDNVCSQTSPAFVLNHYPSIQPVVQATGQIQPCTFDSLQLSLFVNYNSYNWSTGDTVPSIYVSQTGYYQVAVTDNFGCNLTSQPFVVNNSFLNPPDICIVGVDSANHNRLVWERQANNLIDSFYVYRESFIAGQYVKIGALPFTQTSLFTDTNSNPAIQSYRYKIAAVDTCGGVTLLSDFHKTIHLTINAGLNGSWNLIWDGYQGFPFSTYRIYRGTNANSMSLLTQLPSTATSYTDLNPPTGTVYYQIEVIKNSGCYPDTVTSKANTNYNTSRSNTANNGSIAPIFLTADFNADVMSGQWPIQVSFTDISTGLPDSWEWDFGDGNTSIAQNPKHTYNNTGVYTVRLKVCNGSTCDTTTKVGYINVQPNGQVEIGVTLAAKLYPNPNDGSFTLELTTASQKEAQLHIYNSVGQLITQEQLEINQHLRKQIQLNGQAPGVYFVHVSTDKGIVYREKVIIQ